MIAIIPLMGLGDRFKKKGYSEYKPFVRIQTEQLIKKVLSPLKNFDKIYIICNEHTASELNSILDFDVEIIIHNYETRGASETLMIGYDKYIKNTKIVCVDCDTIFDESAINKVKINSGNFILTFEDIDKTGLYSYVEITDGYISNIEEKNPISTIANAGLYVFSDKEVLKKCCEGILNNESELYLSKAIKYGILNGIKFKSVDVSNEFNCCGTPQQLKNYSNLSNEKHILCFDIDGTLIRDLYKSPVGIEKNVKFCNEAYKNGHKIILNTARGMLSTNGDANLIEQKRNYIISVLNKVGIMYHELVLMKPYADLYIDDKSISSHKDLEKETGIYLFEEHNSRSHHKIVIDGNLITKFGELTGENYYYSNLPSSILDMFPNIIYSDSKKITMENIKKPTYSSLLLSQKLTTKDLNILFKSLTKIHNQNIDVKTLDLLWGYKSKIMERIKESEELYSKLNIDLNYFNNIINEINYVKLSRIHGDPVFTNIFLEKENTCKFIDPRGIWDNNLTYCGDLFYDHCKVLQSLYGYDHLLHKESIPNSYLKSLRDFYYSKIVETYPTVNIGELKNKVKLLYLSMIPFHSEDIEKCRNFLDLLITI